METLEAIIDENGVIKLLKPIHLSTKRRALVTILDAPDETKLRPYGLCAGDFVVPDDFDESLPEELLADFEGK